jgi:glycosyltransferase involved in cell wall biosynthesis
VQQGHEVTVLTSQYDPALPRYDVQAGVKIVRVPVAARISKGVIMPSFGPMAWKLALKSDVIHLHLPQFDAPGVALRGRLLNKPVVLTYHCDLQLPPGLFNRLVDRVVLLMNQLAGHLSDAVVTYTRDYGTHSPFLSSFVDKKLRVIPPPVEMVTCTEDEARAFRDQHQLAGHEVIGIAARLATEKGIEVLLKALPLVQAQFPNVKLLHAGPYENIIGEEAYAARLAPLFKQYEGTYHRLGLLEGAEFAAFYRNLDVLCMCSLNSTESFGMVQIEAMQSGVPVATCALPGVRQPVMMTGMGEITPIGDHEALAEAIINILRDKEKYLRDAQLIGDSFLPSVTAAEYVRLFEDLLHGRFQTKSAEPPAYEQLRSMRDSYQ